MVAYTTAHPDGSGEVLIEEIRELRDLIEEMQREIGALRAAVARLIAGGGNDGTD